MVHLFTDTDSVCELNAVIISMLTNVLYFYGQTIAGLMDMDLTRIADSTCMKTKNIFAHIF